MNEKENEPNIQVSKTLGLSESGRKGKWFKRLLLFGIPVLIGIAVLLKWSASDSGDNIRYTTQPAKQGELTITVTATGNLQPTNQVDVGSELSGIVETVEADFNAPVKVGQVLARLDTTKLKTQVLQSAAALESAKAKVLQVRATIEEARNQLNRLEQLSRLSSSKAVSRFDLDAAKANMARALADESSAKASVSQARAILEANETDMAKAIIYSPIDGIVLTRSVEPGQTVAASFQAPVLFTLAEDLAEMELHVDVDEADVGKVQTGQEASFFVDAYPERIFPAKISQVRFGSQTVDGVVTYETVLTVDNSDLSLRPGMTATAEIVVEKVENSVLVPNAALRFSPPADQTQGKSSGGGILNKIFLRRSRGPDKSRGEGNGQKSKQRVWTLKNEQLVSIPVVIGQTDGINTQILEGEISPDMPLVVDVVEGGR